MVNEEKLRLFFALWPDPPVQAALAQWARSAHTQAGGRLIQQQNLHLTLAFLGDTPLERLGALERIGTALSMAPFDLTFDDVRCFRGNRIAWAALRETPEGLLRLVHDLRRRLGEEGFPVEAREYTPHVSLLRQADCGRLPCRPSPPITWRATTLALVRSILGGAGGSRYEPIWRMEAGD